MFIPQLNLPVICDAKRPPTRVAVLSPQNSKSHVMLHSAFFLPASEVKDSITEGLKFPVERLRCCLNCEIGNLRDISRPRIRNPTCSLILQHCLFLSVPA